MKKFEALETPLNTIAQRLVLLVFLGSAMLLLPACGSKNNVKTEKPPETVLSSEASPLSNESSSTSDIGMPGENKTPANTYVERIKRTKTAKGTQISLTPSTETTVPATAANPSVPVNTPVAMETPIRTTKSGSSHWFWWLLLVVVLGGIGWYFWNKSQSNGPFQPMPPTGGLSPVSGFTAVKDRIEDETEAETSIWTRKLF